MESRILHSSYVIDFLDVDFSSKEISKILKSETDRILEKFNDERLKDWEIQFQAIYGKGQFIRVYTKMPSYPKDRIKSITVHIPIPEKKLVEWGGTSNQFLELGRNPKAEINVLILSVDFSEYSSRAEYIIDSFRRAIKFCFENGFTANGVKIRDK